MKLLASGFASVDEVKDADSFIRCLNFIHSLPFFQECKQQSYQIMKIHPGASVLEIGCGNGIDTQILTEMVAPCGRITAIDISTKMLFTARAHMGVCENTVVTPDFLLCDAHYLAFPDKTFDAVRADRVLQHTKDPSMVIREMVRVTRLSGRIVVFEPDWGTYLLWPGEREINKKIVTFWNDSIPSGYIGRSLYALFSAAGLTEIEVWPMCLTLTDLTLAKILFDLENTISLAVQKGIVDREQADNLNEALSHAAKVGQFFSSLTFFLVKGVKS